MRSSGGLTFIAATASGFCTGVHLWMPPTRPDVPEVIGQFASGEFAVVGDRRSRSVRFGTLPLDLSRSLTNSVVVSSGARSVARIPVWPWVFVAEDIDDTLLLATASIVASGLALWTRRFHMLIGMNWPASISRMTIVPEGHRRKALAARTDKAVGT